MGIQRVYRVLVDGKEREKKVVVCARCAAAKKGRLLVFPSSERVSAWKRKTHTVATLTREMLSG